MFTLNVTTFDTIIRRVNFFSDFVGFKCTFLRARRKLICQISELRFNDFHKLELASTIYTTLWDCDEYFILLFLLLNDLDLKLMFGNQRRKCVVTRLTGN